MVTLLRIERPEEEVTKHVETNTTAFLKERELGKGTLIIAENRLCWLTDDERGFALEYRNIALHAVSKDLSYFPCECLYLMVDEGGDGSESDESESSRVTEIRFVPENNSHLDALFKVISECQTLHPDPDDSFSEEDGNDGQFDDAEEGDGDNNHRTIRVDYNVAVAEQVLGVAENNNGVNEHQGDEAMDVTPGQFEDAEEEK